MCLKENPVLVDSAFCSITAIEPSRAPMGASADRKTRSELAPNHYRNFTAIPPNLKELVGVYSKFQMDKTRFCALKIGISWRGSRARQHGLICEVLPPPLGSMHEAELCHSHSKTSLDFRGGTRKRKNASVNSQHLTQKRLARRFTNVAAETSWLTFFQIFVISLKTRTSPSGWPINQLSEARAW